MVLVTLVIVVMIVLRLGGHRFGRGGKRLFFGRLCGAQTFISQWENCADVTDKSYAEFVISLMREDSRRSQFRWSLARIRACTAEGQTAPY
jgi:hypothetical protein